MRPATGSRLMKNRISGTSLPHTFQVASDPLMGSFHHCFCVAPSMVPAGLVARGLGKPDRPTVAGGLLLLYVRPASITSRSIDGSTLRLSRYSRLDSVNSSGIAWSLRYERSSVM